MALCICASPRWELCSAPRKLKARLGDESSSTLSAAALCHFGPGERDSPCPISDVCSSADHSGPLDCQWERRTPLGDAFCPSAGARPLEKHSLDQTPVCAAEA